MTSETQQQSKGFYNWFRHSGGYIWGKVNPVIPNSNLMFFINSLKAAVSYLTLGYLTTFGQSNPIFFGNVMVGGNAILTVFELIDALYLIHYKRYAKFNITAPLGNIVFWAAQIIIINGKGTNYKNSTDLIGLLMSISTLIPGLIFQLGIYPKKDDEEETGTKYFHHPFKVFWRVMRVISWATVLKLPLFASIPAYLMNYLVYPLVIGTFLVGLFAYSGFENSFKKNGDKYQFTGLWRFLYFMVGIGGVIGTGFFAYMTYYLGFRGDNFELIDRNLFYKVCIGAWSLCGIGAAFGYHKGEEFASFYDYGYD